MAIRLIFHYSGICVGEPIMLVMELAKLGPLNKYLRVNCANVPTTTVTFFMYQVCEVRVCA